MLLKVHKMISKMTCKKCKRKMSYDYRMKDDDWLKANKEKGGVLCAHCCLEKLGLKVWDIVKADSTIDKQKILKVLKKDRILSNTAGAISELLKQIEEELKLQTIKKIPIRLGTYGDIIGYIELEEPEIEKFAKSLICFSLTFTLDKDKKVTPIEFNLIPKFMEKQ